MKIEIELERLKELLHVATGNIKDFVMDNDGFIYYPLQNLLYYLLQHVI